MKPGAPAPARGVALISTLTVALALGACAGPDPGAGTVDDVPEASMNDDGWITLFDGTSLDSWKGFRRDDVPDGWTIEDGLLTFTPGLEGGDLVTRDQYGDFELALEWRISPGGNSGIFYRASEEADQIWETAPEMQVLDDERHADGADAITSAGANYALHAPSADIVKSAGEWNSVRIIARGDHIEHWLNGEKVVEYEIGSPEWEALVDASKFSELPDYGRRARGHIGLQDHGDPVWYRNIRIRTLDNGE